MAMETFFIILFIIAFSIALGIIAYTLYDMSKKISSTSTEETFDEKFKAIQEELNDTFENLSNKVLVDQSDKSLEKMKKSLNELLDNFEKNQISSLNKNTDELTKEIVIQKELTKLISEDNKKFEKILNSPGPRGDWGEFRIKQILETAGLKEGIHYTHNKKTETSSDRPDYVINMADGKKLILDSKFPFTAFSEYLDTEDLNERKKLITKHASETRKQMESLSKKKYWDQYKDAAPFVIMVLPSDELLYAAFQGDETLLNDSVKNNIYLCSPINLLAMMQVIFQGHTNINLNENAQKVILAAKELLNVIANFGKSFKMIGYHGEKLVKFQRDAAKNFENKLKPKLEKIEELGAKLDKGKQIDPGIKMIEELPYAIEDEDNKEEPSEEE